MAFEQSQQTRVESKQYSGDWSRFAAPSGSTGNATEPFYTPSMALDLSPVARSINSIGDTMARNAEAERNAREKEEKRLQDIGGAELLEDLRKINESTPEGSKREELVKRRIARGIQELGLDYHDVQNLRSYTVNDYSHSYQSMLEEATKKANVESRQYLAKLADEVRPEMAGRPFDERVEAGQKIAQSRDKMQFYMTNMVDKRTSPEDREAYGRKIAPETFKQMANEDVRQFFANPNQWGEKQTNIMADALTEALTNEGVDYRTAKYNSGIVSNHMYKIAHQQEDDLNKLILDEQKQQIDRMTNMSRMAVFEDYINAQPQYRDGMSDEERKAEDERVRRRRGQGVTIALMGLDPTKDPSVMADIWANPPDVDRFKLQDGVRRWNGQFDYETAHFGFKYGNPNTVNASFEGMYQEAKNRGTPEGYTQLSEAMMSPQMKDILLRVSPEAVDVATANIMAGEKEIVESQIRDYVRATTAVKDGRAVGYSVFDSSDKINEVMDASRARMDNVGMPADKREQVMQEVFKDFGLDFGQMSYNPEEVYQYAEQKFKEYTQKHWFKSFFNEFADAARDPTMTSLGVMAARRTYSEWKNGDISTEEALQRFFTGLKDLPEDIVPKTKEGAPIIQRSVEDEVASSPEFISMMQKIAEDPSIPQDKKPEVAQNKFMEMVKNAGKAIVDEFGVKSANAKTLDDNKSYDNSKVYYVHSPETIPGVMKHKMPEDDLFDEKLLHFADNSDRYFIAKYITDKEGFREKKYKLGGENKYTIGVGHQIWGSDEENFVGPDGTITRENAVKLLERDIVDRENEIKKAIGDSQYNSLPIELKAAVIDAAFHYDSNKFSRKFPKLISLLKKYKDNSDVSLLKDIARESHSTTSSGKTNLKSRNEYRDSLILSLA